MAGPERPTRASLSALPALVLAAPVLIGIAYSMAAAVGVVGAGADGFTWRHVADALTSSWTWRSVGWTLWTAGLATLLSAGGAVLLAGPVSRTRAGRVIALLPLAVPHVAAALAVLLLLGQSGLLARVLLAMGWIQGPADMPALVYDPLGVGLVLAFVWKELPFLLLVAVGVHETLGDGYTDAARTLGASPATIWRRITLPLLWRGVAPNAIAVLAFLLGQYEMAVVLAPSDPLPLAMLTAERATDSALVRRGEAHVLALIAMTLAGVLVVWHEYVRSQTEEA